MSQVIRPRIPYQGPICEGIHEGKKIKIKGYVPFGADRFTVNLMSRLDSDCDRPLHLSVRFKQNAVVRNTYQNHWGPEETSGSFPFVMGNNFTMMIEVQRNAYKISVSGQHCWSYAHRLPFSKVRSILIDGDVSIEQIEFINKLIPHVNHSSSTPVNTSGDSSGPSLFSAISSSIKAGIIDALDKNFTDTVSEGQKGPSQTQTKELSYIFPIHGGIRPGMSIYISGRPTGYPNKFTINIQKGASAYPPPDIAFHFDVRFFNHSIVRNSRLNDVWYAEEKMISHFPFQAGCNFDVVIQIQNDTYAIMVNGQHFVKFRHRLNTFSHFNVLSIENDVIITSIKYT